MLTDAEIEKGINQFFEDNYALLQLEGGHALSRDVREGARLQTQMYWRKLRFVAESVTDTEVKLNLPNQTTPAGRAFGIEGVVDIVRDADGTVMYDLKTHNAQTIRGNLSSYEDQLNVYAHIWQHLRGQSLDSAAVICTDLPRNVRDAAQAKDNRRLMIALDQWQPIIEIDFDAERVHDTVRHFGEVVDQIESGEFAPPPIEALRANAPGTQLAFAVHTCRNCDARFSCASYRLYLRSSSRGNFEASFKKYALDDYGDDDERALRRLATLADNEDSN